MADSADLIVIASARAKSGHANELEQALREVAEPTRAQPGCVLFGLYRSAEDSSVIIGFERWHPERTISGTYRVHMCSDLCLP